MFKIENFDLSLKTTPVAGETFVSSASDFDFTIRRKCFLQFIFHNQERNIDKDTKTHTKKVEFDVEVKAPLVTWKATQKMIG